MPKAAAAQERALGRMHSIKNQPALSKHSAAAGNQPAANRPHISHALRSADFQVCCIAGFQTRRAQERATACRLEVGDTAGLEACATGLPSLAARQPVKYPGEPAQRYRHDVGRRAHGSQDMKIL
jgi:hypothetical protein